MTRVRSGQLWIRKTRPYATAVIVGRIRGQVTYHMLNDDKQACITISVASFKYLYRKVKLNEQYKSNDRAETSR